MHISIIKSGRRENGLINISEVQIMNWWLAAYYILQNYVKLEYRSNRIVFGVIVFEIFKCLKTANPRMYMKIKVETVQKLLCNWLNLDDGFWNGVDISSCMLE